MSAIRCFWCEKVDGNIFRRMDTNDTFVLAQAPPGAMYYADWLGARGPDGHCLIVVTPWGPWNVDAGYHYPQKGHWARSGNVPNVTVWPSIGQSPTGAPPWSYHGWLRAGVLEDCE